MPVEYAPETIRALEAVFAAQGVARPFRRQHYEPGTVLEFEIRGVHPDGRAKAALEIRKFVGGGFAGQVYQVVPRAIEPVEGRVEGLEVGRIYALKILIPPSRFSSRIRNLFYGFGFQAPFSLQSLAAAGRSQALWQKFIRRAAQIEFGRVDVVADVIGTMRDEKLGSYGELSEWIDGRMWRFEVDDDLDARREWKPGDPEDGVGSPEYRTKREFMRRLVTLLHEMGAVELARQYEWWSLKSQPNAMKRTASDPDPRAGLVAVDFRAGMALTPLNPQCPIDFELIIRGLSRGRLVQFDKGDLKKLERYLNRYAEAFVDLRPALDALKREDAVYRDSLIDVTYHHFKLFGGLLRHRIMDGFREGWRVRNITDDKAAAGLKKSGLLSFFFLWAPWLALASPLLFIFDWPGPVWWKYPLYLLPLVGAPFVRKIWGRSDLRRHYGRIIASPRYFIKAGRARIAEAMIRWVRAGRASEERALKIVASPLLYYLQWPLTILPPGLHRFVTDGTYFKERLKFVFVRPFRLYFNAGERERWLLEMITRGVENRLLSETEADHIRSQIKESFVQKYLKSVAVHICTLPVTHVVAIIIAFIYIKARPELSWQQATVAAGMIIALFQVTPISPGSIARGLYTTYLVIKERNFRDYKLAFALSYFKYIGYLAFPLQMAYRYPELARFMAGHWATGAVHIVPIFGEKGAWLEHYAFDTFYNFPLTIQRRMKRRAKKRAGQKPRIWHIPLVVAAGLAVLIAINGVATWAGAGPVIAFGKVWGGVVWVPLFASALISRGAGGMKLGRRIGGGAIGGAVLGFGYALLNTLWPEFFSIIAAADVQSGGFMNSFAVRSIWYMFLFTLIAFIGAFVAETREP
jgi:hypothetical protein